MNSNKYLKIKHSISRGRDTYGYNIVTLWDGNKRYATCGGGYDLLGTVFGEWLKCNYLERLKALKPYDEKYSMDFYNQHGYQPQQENYGLFCRNENLSLDGGCGLDCMISLARKIGLKIERNYNRKRNCTEGFLISEVSQ